MSWLSDAFSAGTNPADKAMPYLNDLPGELLPYFQSYMNNGRNAYDLMNPILSEMTSDPTGYMNKLMASYMPSKDYQLRLGESERAAGNSAAAGGMRGSLSDITNQAQLADRLLGNDMQEWLHNVIGAQDTGLQGLGHLYDIGYGASTGYAGDLSNIRGTQAQLAFQGQREEDQRKNDLLKALIGGAGSIAGGIFGGPIGSALGGAFGSMFTPSYNYGSPSGNTSFPDFNTPPGDWM